ncbi:MAG: 2-hydroxyacyl-CoA dehydratase [Candidatus Auribacter fodinae]|jgi:benzoyl-CoA reductase/2-hydroxyglutaryl-CoA dehydratase subunit BcrC/BadD/HgdB|uniref:2-hydroxyacyl-CoA dehydratase n=1 Tax=Candidatus Auribacter fodinae TaxID=2093366 RepID=A0A3A4QZQ0_9BACT|nr:MAG: 2-hydroxyacyl-CoA dehydratase [Candidatus Auribacter fodinae]
MDNQFNDIYRVTADSVTNPGNLKKQRFIEEQQKQLQSAIAHRPSGIAYFENMMYSGQPATGSPRVGYFCNMIPQELIAAFGAQAVRIDCGNSAAATVGEEVLSGDICPLAKASFGKFLVSESPAASCDVLIMPTSCDAKRKMGEVLNDIKPTFMFNLPPEQNHERFMSQTVDQMIRLSEFLHKHLGVRLSRRRLRDVIRQYQRRTLMIRSIQDERIREPRSLSIRDFFLIIQSSLFSMVDLDEWISHAEAVLEEMKLFSADRKNLRPRIVLTGAPMIWPNYKVLNLLEECGADVVADTLCSGAQSCVDPVVIDETGKKALIRALTNKYVYASICPCFISQTTRMNRIIDLVDQSRANGVVNHSLRLCQLFDIENYRIERTLKNKQVPFINIRTDYSLEDTEQLRVRIEAFLETLW